MIDLTKEFLNKKSEVKDDLSWFRAVRFAYRVGKPIIEDVAYDLLVEKIKVEHPLAEELFQTYDDDKIDQQELLSYGLDEFDIMVYSAKREIKREFKYDLSFELIAEDNKSIISKKTLEDEYDTIKALGSGNYCFSPKMDGIFASSIWERIEGDVYQLKCGKSRGDISSSLDITNSLTHILPQTICIPNRKEDSIKISFEGVYREESVISSGYKNQRSACQGVLSATVNKKTSLYGEVQLICHGTSLTGNYYDNMQLLKEIGFKVVPISRLYFDANMSFEDYLVFIAPVKEDIKYWSALNKIELDGIVVLLEDYSDDKDGIHGNKQYNKNVYAIKTEYWNNGYYEAKVTGFEGEQQDSDISYKILFEPVTTHDNKVLTKVTDIRLRTLRDAQIRVGDTIGFYYYNGTTIKFKEKIFKRE